MGAPRPSMLVALILALGRRAGGAATSPLVALEEEPAGLEALPRSVDICTALTGNVCAFQEARFLSVYTTRRVQEIASSEDFGAFRDDWSRGAGGAVARPATDDVLFKQAFYFHVRICSTLLSTCVVSGNGFDLEGPSAASFNSKGVTWMDHLNLYMPNLVMASNAANKVGSFVAAGVSRDLRDAAKDGGGWVRVPFAGCQYLPNSGRALEACRGLSERDNTYSLELYPGLVVNALFHVTPLRFVPEFFAWPSPAVYANFTANTGKSANKDKDLLYVVSGFLDSGSRPITPCNSGYSSFCSQHNVKYLAGKAYRMLHSADDYHVLMDIAVQITHSSSYRVSSTDTASNTDFYVFFISDEGPIIAHKYEEYINKPLWEISDSARDSNLHDILLEGSKVNGGYGSYVTYNWPRAGICTENCDGAWTDRKVAYVFKYNRFGVSAYVGVGYNHERRAEIPADTRSEPPTECSDLFALPCATTNAEDLVSHVRSAIYIKGLQTVLDEVNALSEEYRIGTAYVFIADSNATILAHGDIPDAIVGKTLEEYGDTNPILSNTTFSGTLTHRRIATVAQSGGGWVAYPWFDSGGNAFEKVTFVRSHIDGAGRTVYIGSGLNQLPAPVEVPDESASALEQQCSARYETNCSRQQAIALVGASVAQLNIAIGNDMLEYGYITAFAYESISGIMSSNYSQTLVELTPPQETRERAFHVTVIDTDGNIVASDEPTLLSEATAGANATWGSLYSNNSVSMAWNLVDVLSAEGVTSLNGQVLLKNILDKSYLGGGWVIERDVLLVNVENRARTLWLIYVSKPVCKDIEVRNGLDEFFMSPPLFGTVSIAALTTTPFETNAQDLSTCVIVMSHINDASPVEDCPVGYYKATDEAGRVVCEMCQPGYFQDGESQATQCDPCPVETYAPDSGSASCMACPDNTVSQTRASTEIASCQCREGTFNAGQNTGESCAACPEHAECVGGTMLPSPISGAWGNPKCQFAFAKCPVEEAFCLGSFYCREGHAGKMCQRCAHGYGRPFTEAGECKPCAEGKIQVLRYIGAASILAFTCSLTVQSDLAGSATVKPMYSQIMRIAITYIQVIALLVKSGLPWPKLIQDLGYAAQSVLGGGAQTISVSECLFTGIKWTNDTSTLHGVLDVSPKSPQMLRHIFGMYMDLLMPFLSLAISLALISILAAMKTIRVRRGKILLNDIAYPRALFIENEYASSMSAHELEESVSAGEIDEKAFGISLMGWARWTMRIFPKLLSALIYVVWPTQLTIALSAFSARPVDARLALSADYQECHANDESSASTLLWNSQQDDEFMSGVHLSHAVAPAGIWLAVIVAYPTVLSVYLHRNAKRVVTRDSDMEFDLGFFYRDYSTKYYNWEAVALVNKLFLAISVTVVKPFGSYYTVLLLLGACFVGSVVHARYSPYTTPLVNRTARFVQYAMFLSMYLTLFFQPTFEKVTAEIAAIALIVLQCVVAFLICVTIAHTFLVAHLAKLLIDIGGDEASISPADVTEYFKREFGPIAGWIAQVIFAPITTVQAGYETAKKLHRENSIVKSMLRQISFAGRALRNLIASSVIETANIKRSESMMQRSHAFSNKYTRKISLRGFDAMRGDVMLEAKVDEASIVETPASPQGLSPKNESSHAESFGEGKLFPTNVVVPIPGHPPELPSLLPSLRASATWRNGGVENSS